MKYEQLRLQNQLCFPVYAASRLITREYQPYLDKLGITYPQYLVLMVLWETDKITVNEIAKKLILNTNTLTPLLKRLEAQELITRERSDEDERKVIIGLTKKGVRMQNDAVKIPDKLAAELLASNMSIEDLTSLKSNLETLITYLAEKQKEQ